MSSGRLDEKNNSRHAFGSLRNDFVMNPHVILNEFHIEFLVIRAIMSLFPEGGTDDNKQTPATFYRLPELFEQYASTSKPPKLLATTIGGFSNYCITESRSSTCVIRVPAIFKSPLSLLPWPRKDMATDLYPSLEKYG